MEEMCDLIDERGKVIGSEKRSIVHAKGLRHSGIYLIILDERGRIFVQQGAEGRYLMPLHWDFSVSKHLKPGESYRGAALRGAEEELSIKVRNLKPLGKIDFHFKYKTGEKDNESNQVLQEMLEGE